MKVYVVNVFYDNVFYDEVEQPQVSRIFQLTEEGTQEEIQKETIIYEKSGTVVLACEDETRIMDTLRQRISDRITSFELVSETDVTQPPEESGTMQLMTETISEPVGEIIFQIGI